MQITNEWLDANNACREGRDWFNAQNKTDFKEVIRALIKDSKLDWANWTLTKVLSYRENVLYSVYAAKQCLHAYEKAYPKDKRVRDAINAASKWAQDPSEANRSAAESAAWSARSAAESAAWSARSAESAVWKRILKYGLRIHKEVKE